MATRIVFDLGNRVKVSPPLYDKKLNIQPGDLTKFAPYGNGVYGYQNPCGGNPFMTAPSQEASGGVVYFGCRINKDDFKALLRFVGVKSDYKDYVIFVGESEEPGKDGYLVQIRVVTKFGLRFMFDAISSAEYDKFPEQQLTIGEVLEGFVTHEMKRWGTWFTQDEEKGLAGLFGGDGDFAREELAFGFMVENEYNGVYRIWSRAWLVTK